MKKAICLALLIAAATATGTGKAFAQDLNKAADMILNAVSLLPDNELTGISQNYMVVVNSLNTIGTLKSTAESFQALANVFYQAKNYKSAKAQGRNGDMEATRRELLKASAAFVGSVGSQGMGLTQGAILGMAVQATQNYINIIGAHNDQIIVTDAVLLTDYDDLIYPGYEKYISLAARMIQNKIPLKTVHKVITDLKKIDDTLVSRGATEPYYTPKPRYKEGDRGPGRGYVFEVPYDRNYFEFLLLDRGLYDWNEVQQKVAAHNQGSGTNGKKGWRLPEPKELTAIYNTFIKTDKVPGVPRGSYWGIQYTTAGKAPYAQNFGPGREESKNPNKDGKRGLLIVRTLNGVEAWY